MALYADDMLLLLYDADPSLLGALHILGTFSTVTQLKAPYPLIPSMMTTIKAWNLGLSLLEKGDPFTLSPHTTLWNRPLLQHFYAIPDPRTLAKSKKRSISQIIENRELMSFSLLRSKYHIPYHYLFRHLQLAHVLLFSHQPIHLKCSDLEVLLYSDSLNKPALTLYSCHVSSFNGDTTQFNYPQK